VEDIGDDIYGENMTIISFDVPTGKYNQNVNTVTTSVPYQYGSGILIGNPTSEGNNQQILCNTGNCILLQFIYINQHSRDYSGDQGQRLPLISNTISCVHTRLYWRSMVASDLAKDEITI
jgi:hypothetical protein